MFCIFVMYNADIVAMIEATVLIFFIIRLKNGGSQVTQKEKRCRDG